MGLFSLAFQIGSMAEVSEEDARLFMEEFEEVIGDIDAIGIFLHNSAIALPMFVPGFGIAWGFFSGGSTGYAFAAIQTLTPDLWGVPSLARRSLSPFGFMELVGYSLATSRSYILIRMVMQKIPIKPAMRPTIIEIGILIGLLLAGGVLEDFMIKLVQEGAIVPPGT